MLIQFRVLVKMLRLFFNPPVIRHLDFSTNAKKTLFDVQLLPNDHKHHFCAKCGKNEDDGRTQERMGVWARVMLD